MPVVELLAKDHRAIEHLLTALGETSGREPDLRVERFTHLQALLQAHARAEEEVVYRRLHASRPDEEEVLEAFEEHHVADILLQELASAASSSRSGTSASRRCSGRCAARHRPSPDAPRSARRPRRGATCAAASCSC